MAQAGGQGTQFTVAVKHNYKRQAQSLLQLTRISARKRVMKGALTYAVTPMRGELRKQIRSNSKKRTGELPKAVISKVTIYPSGTALALVGIANKKVGLVNPGNYFHLVSLGTAPHTLAGLTRVRRGKRKTSVRVPKMLTVTTWRIMVAPGVWRTITKHPGAKATDMLPKAVRAAGEKVMDRFLKRFDERFAKEMAKQQGGQS